MEDELLSCYNSEGQALSPVLRSVMKSSHRPVGFYTAVADIWVVDEIGRLLCSKRSEFVQGNPGKWQTYFGGHAKSGVSILQTAIDELAEEIGFQVLKKDLTLLNKGRDDIHLSFYEDYALLYSSEKHKLQFNDGEVSEVKWMTMSEYNIERGSYPEKWCNNASQEDQELLKKWLRSIV